MTGSAVSEPAPELVGELGGPLEQAAVQVEHVARVGLAARRAAQQQRQLAVGLGLLGQVVVDDEGVLAVVHPVLADGAAGVGGEVLERRRVGRRGPTTTTVYSMAPCSVRVFTVWATVEAFWPDGDVDALHAQTLLVQDRVDADRGLAGLAVADDQLALAPTDGGHGVDGLDAGLERLVHRLAAGDARAPGPPCGACSAPAIGPLPSIGSPRALTTRPSMASPTGTDRMRPVARTGLPSSTWAAASASPSDHRADGVLVEVQGQARRCRPRTRAARSRRRRAGPTPGRCRRRPRGRGRPGWPRATGCSPPRFFWSAAVMSPVLMVSSAIRWFLAGSERLTELGRGAGARSRR